MATPIELTLGMMYSDHRRDFVVRCNNILCSIPYIVANI